MDQSHCYSDAGEVIAEDMVQTGRYKPQQYTTYRKTSSISRTKSQSLTVSCILLQLSSLNPLKPDVKLRMKM